MLTETLIVSTFVTVTLLYVFIQFRQTNQNYNRTFSYNTINSLYAVEQIRTYILDLDFDNIKSTLEGGNKKYLNLTQCPADLFTEKVYCEKLFEALDVKSVYFTFDNISGLKEEFKKDFNVNEKTIIFLDYIDYENNSSDVRLIVHFQDDTHATLRFGQEG